MVAGDGDEAIERHQEFDDRQVLMAPVAEVSKCMKRIPPRANEAMVSTAISCFMQPWMSPTTSLRPSATGQLLNRCSTLSCLTRATISLVRERPSFCSSVLIWDFTVTGSTQRRWAI